MTPEQKLDAILEKLAAQEKPPKAGDRKLEWSKLGITTVIAVITIVIGFIQYISTSSLSVREPYLQKQTELCLQASEHAARLATTSDMLQWKKSWEEFWMLYWGPLAVVEEAGSESHVADNMVVMGKALMRYGPTPPSLPVRPVPRDKPDLTGPAINVALSCRDLFSSKWRAGILGWFENR